MNRSLAQSISRNLAADLYVFDVAIAEAKSDLAFLTAMGLDEGQRKQLKKLLEQMKAKRADRAVLQWKLKKAIAGNASYLTASDLQKLRSFLKESIKISEGWRVHIRENRKSMFPEWKEYRKQYKKIVKLIQQDEGNQRKLRQMIVVEGIISRGRLAVGSSVKIIAKPLYDSSLQYEHPEYKHTGYTAGMDAQMGKIGTVKQVKQWRAGGPDLYQVEIAENEYHFWWTKRQLLKMGVM